MRNFYNDYVEVAKYAFAIGAGATLAWSLVRGGRKLVENAASRVASLASTDTPEIGDDD